MNVPRRRLLQVAAAVSGLGGVSFAGCTDLSDLRGGGVPGPDRDRPSYAQYLPSEGLFTDEDAEAFGGLYVFVDFETFAEADDLDFADSVATPEEPIEGSRSGDIAFFAGPTLGLVLYAFGMFGLLGYSFVGDLLPAFDAGGETEAQTDLATRLGLLTPFGYVFLGDYDVETLEGAAEGFESVDEREGYTVFEGESGDDGFDVSMTEGLAFAASAEAVLIPLPDTSKTTPGSAEQGQRNREMIDTMIDVVSGPEASLAETDADVDWMLRTTGHGVMGIGTYGNGEQLPEDGVDDGLGDGMGGTDGSEFFDDETRQALDDIAALTEDATGYGSDIELADASTITGRVALAYDTAEDVPSDESFEEVFGDVTGEFSMESGETRVYLTVTQSLETADA